MKKKYVYPLLKHKDYYPEEAYADVTVPGFGSIGSEDLGTPDDEW